MSARPWFTPTQRQREQVRTWAAAGLDHASIARGLGLHVSSVRRHFAAELHAGGCVAWAEVCEAMHRKALAGNVAAARLFLSGALGRHRD